MRIAVITTSYPQTDDDPSGHFVRAEVQGLVNHGHQVTVICPGQPTSPEPHANPQLLRLGASALFGWPGALSRLRTNPLAIRQLIPFVLKARATLLATPFEAVTAHWLVPGGWPISSASTCRTEIVVHGSDARLVARLPSWLRERFLLSLKAKGHQLRFVAPHLRTLLATSKTQAWLMNSPVFACPMTMPNLPSQSESRQTLGLHTETFVATILGRLVASKRVDIALQHAPLPSNAQVYVVGSGPCLDDLRRRFPNVVFLGHLPRSRALMWLRASNVLLNASMVEGAPTVVREARALGVEVWTAPSEAVSSWAAVDPGICIRPEFA